MAGTTMTCGDTGACHTDHTQSNHGGSAGGQTCYGCHSSYQASMEDGLGTKTGAEPRRLGPPRDGQRDARRRHRTERRHLPDIDHGCLLRQLPHRPQLLQREQGRQPALQHRQRERCGHVELRLLLDEPLRHLRQLPRHHQGQAGHGHRPAQRGRGQHAGGRRRDLQHLGPQLQRRLDVRYLHVQRELLQVPQRRADQELPGLHLQVRHPLQCDDRHPRRARRPARRRLHRGGRVLPVATRSPRTATRPWPTWTGTTTASMDATPQATHGLAAQTYKHNVDRLQRAAQAVAHRRDAGLPQRQQARRVRRLPRCPRGRRPHRTPAARRRSPAALRRHGRDRDVLRLQLDRPDRLRPDDGTHG